MTGDVIERAEKLVERIKTLREEGGYQIILPQREFDLFKPRLELVGEMEVLMPELLNEVKQLQWQINNVTECYQERLRETERGWREVILNLESQTTLPARVPKP